MKDKLARYLYMIVAHTTDTETGIVRPFYFKECEELAKNHTPSKKPFVRKGTTKSKAK